MDTNFQVIGIDKSEFNYLFQLNEEQLNNLSAIRSMAKNKPGYPCRVSLEDVEVGEEVILFSYKHHKTNSPYQSIGPIFIRKDAKNCDLKVNEIPKMLSHRLLSLRGYDKKGIMLKATATKGVEIEEFIQNIFVNKFITYIHVHNSSPGCFNCEIRRI